MYAFASSTTSLRLSGNSVFRMRKMVRKSGSEGGEKVTSVREKTACIYANSSRGTNFHSIPILLLFFFLFHFIPFIACVRVPFLVESNFFLASYISPASLLPLFLLYGYAEPTAAGSRFHFRRLPQKIQQLFLSRTQQ